jgi:hypothetical protein
VNCKPGDLARIVYPDQLVRDRWVTVTELSPQSTPANPAWCYEGPLIIDPDIRIPLGALYDFWLRPIRDPGDDARDETLQWLDVPSKQPEAVK